MRAHTTTKLNRMLSFLLAMGMMLAAGLAGALDVYAAGYGEAVTVVIPYTHIYDAPASRSGDSFSYRIEPVGGAPLPEGSRDGAYVFSVEAPGGGKAVTGDVELRIAFPSKGEYRYRVSSADGADAGGFIYENRTYTLTMYVKTDKAGEVSCLVTATGDNGRKYERLQLNPAYDTEGMVVRPISTPEGDGNIDEVTVPKRSVNNARNANNANNGGVTADGADGQTVTVEEEQTKLSEIMDSIVPKAAPDRHYWALINLIEAIMSAGIAIALAVNFFRKPSGSRMSGGGKWQLAAAIPAIISAVTCGCTEDLSGAMGFVDEWTPFMTACMLASIVLAWAAGRMNRKESNL